MITNKKHQEKIDELTAQIKEVLLDVAKEKGVVFIEQLNINYASGGGATVTIEARKKLTLEEKS